MDLLGEPVILSDGDHGKEDEVLHDNYQCVVEVSDQHSERNDPKPIATKTGEIQASPKEQVSSTAAPFSTVLTSKHTTERDARRKRKQQLYRLLTRPDAPPSFLAVVQAEPKQREDEDEELLPSFVVVDVDAYLGFKAKHPNLVTSLVPNAGLEPSPRADGPSSSTAVSAITTPAEEGFYEGSRPMAMSEDSSYLSDMHVWLRQHLEYFSATDADVTQSQAGRRTKASRGQVGIRCVHCARHIVPKLAKGENVSWPPGAVSFPVKFEGLYATASQKPQLHFEGCPFLPQDSQLAQMLQEARANQRGGAPLTGIGKRKRMVQGLSGLMYYVISCQRIGLQEISGGNGIRFTRDLGLEPLDMERVRTQVELERPDLIPRQYQPKLALLPPVAKVPRVIGPDTPTSSSAPLVESNASTQAVLQKAMEEAGDPEHPLVRMSDRGFLTDFMFLAISQMAFCWAAPHDFVARGKKTKMMRLGFAGFCCRHCRHANTAYSCRSYSSAPDNLASAISNSFVLHLQKCPYTPPEIQLALSSAKRIHSRQMGHMPYGSQRKIFFDLWNRIRAADQPPPEGHDEENASEAPSEGQTSKKSSDVDEEDWDPDQDGVPDELDDEDDQDDPEPIVRHVSVQAPTTIDTNRPNVRGADFPVSSDPEVQAVLKAAEENWDPAKNDHLILPEDRYLVSDYVFLTMRQLRIAMPRPSDFRGNRRNNVIGRMPGLCCMHCADDNMTTPSGRSFPSAPDNLASALNSSFYNHMRYCPLLDPAIQRSLLTLRKLHSQQCSSMTFGSQRRFFTKVFAKLKGVDLTNDQLNSFSSTMGTDEGQLESDVFREHDFVEGGTMGIPFWQCIKCRMVPFEFRAVGGVHYVRPIPQHLKQHRNVCKEDGIHLGWTLIAVKAMCSKYPSDQLHTALTPVIELVVGNDPGLTRLFVGCVESRGQDDTILNETKTTGWWRRLPHSVDSSMLQSVFESSATLLKLSSLKLNDHPAILRVLEIMSPCLQYHVPEEPQDDPAPVTSMEGVVAPPSDPQHDDTLSQVAESSLIPVEVMVLDSKKETEERADTPQAGPTLDHYQADRS